MTKHMPDIEAATASGRSWEIHAIRYGTNQRRTRGDNFILEKHPADQMPMDFYCWILRSSEIVIVVDTGMDLEKAARHGHDITHSPVDVWRSLGIDPSLVETVILTHAHYDHLGHLDAFKNAHFHMQAEEMDYVTGPWMQRPWFRRAYEADEISRLVHLLHSDRLTLHGRDQQIADGVSVHWVGGHCAGQEIVRVRTDRGFVVLASDALHYYEEYERGIPFSVAFNLSDMIAGHERIRELADSDDHVVPAHDPRIAEIYRASTDQPAATVFRLDRPPLNEGIAR
ncbi:N-acyl homoserine lactonase family protein [Agrobacterium pusense]|uniref:Zn-dependent hydrolase, glyoxylase n=2 Tax=Agrobacterium pusense TaxID=648995 RepID=U4QIS6_9HYPH|nr:N-acyl homoserine lactonase family protein [Agrobacterium pusense]CDI12346.1 Zn-dependent hydrolase, glyoxylase [Agrobacterium pusense]